MDSVVIPMSGDTTLDCETQIRNQLVSHSAVRDAAVISHAGHFEAFVTTDDSYIDDVLGRSIAASTRLAKWRKAHDLTQLTRDAASAPVAFNTMGWNSSYTRQPIPAEEMRDWVDNTVAEILRLAPNKVYEVGCGTGMLLMRIAPHCERYVGVDFAPAVLNRLREQLLTVPTLADQVQLLERSADNFDSLDFESFDTVVINSVAQYFPNRSYLTKVIGSALRIVKPGGHIFIGDVRSLPLLPAFAASVEFFRAEDDVIVKDLSERIQRHIQMEQELVISPTYFLALPNTFSNISRVEILPRRGRADTEMSRYRYQAVIHVGQRTEAPLHAEFVEWAEREWTLNDIRSRLHQRPGEYLGIKGILNGRIEDDLALMEILKDADAMCTVGELRRECKARARKGIHPQDLIDLEDENVRVFPSWRASLPDGSYDALLAPAGSLEGYSSPACNWPEPDTSEFVNLTNVPGQNKFRSDLIDQLLAHCRENLPEEIVPSKITLIDVLPRTSEGGIDCAALVTASKMRLG